MVSASHVVEARRRALAQALHQPRGGSVHAVQAQARACHASVVALESRLTRLQTASESLRRLELQLRDCSRALDRAVIELAATISAR